MRWIVDIDREAGRDGLAWARTFLADRDLSKADWLRIDKGRGVHTGVYGRCWHPTKGTRGKGYRLSCQVPGPFPTAIRTRRAPLYRNADGSWPPVPEGCKEGAHCQQTKAGVTTYWIRLTSVTVVDDLSEGIVWIMAHEGFHFLRRTKQIPGRNTEIEADRFADEQLRLFRLERGTC